MGRPDGPGQDEAVAHVTGGQVVVAAQQAAPKRFVRQQVTGDEPHTLLTMHSQMVRWCEAARAWGRWGLPVV